MGKKPELSKELKRSSDKAQKRYVKAYAKALDKHGDEKKARKKAQKKLEKKYELVGKKYEKISDKPQAAPDQQDDDNQTFLVAEARPLAELTRAELYELAKQLEVPGRSSMNKGDLLIAVRVAQ